MLASPDAEGSFEPLTRKNMSPSVAWHLPHALVGCAGLRGGRDLPGGLLPYLQTVSPRLGVRLGLAVPVGDAAVVRLSANAR